MLTIDEIKEKVEPIAKNYGLNRLYLFGSYAKKCADDNSDIDLLYEKGNILSLLGVSGMLQDLTETLGCPIDLVSVHYIEPMFRDEVWNTKVLIYEK